MEAPDQYVPSSRMRRSSGIFPPLQRTTELLMRNEALVKEIVRLKSENSILKKKLSTLLIWKLSHIYLDKNDVAVQTNENQDEDKTLIETWFRDEADFHTPPRSSSSKITSMPRSPRSVRTERAMAAMQKKLPGSQERVTETLADRLKADLNDSSPIVPMSELTSSTLSANRPARKTRRPISYAEPSLVVKVRKGFKFFKFDDTPL